ncbi:MAG: hypothetical protein WDN46_01200 [Methylocella sp.]
MAAPFKAIIVDDEMLFLVYRETQGNASRARRLGATLAEFFQTPSDARSAAGTSFADHAVISERNVNPVTESDRGVAQEG